MMLNNKNNQGLVLPTARLILGIAAILLSLFFSIKFVSDGNTGAGLITAVIFCLVTEFAKVVLTSDCAFYWQTGNGSKALFSAALVAVLFSLSISAAVFVLVLNPTKQETAIKSADSKIQSLEKSIADKQAAVNACNPTFLTRCINPRTAELNALQTELNAILNQADNLNDAKASAEFWSKSAKFLGTNPTDLQFNFALARAVLLDLLGLIFIAQYSATKRINESFVHIAPEEKTINNQDNSAALMAEIEQLKALNANLQQQKQLEQQQNPTSYNFSGLKW